MKRFCGADDPDPGGRGHARANENVAAGTPLAPGGQEEGAGRAEAHRRAGRRGQEALRRGVAGTRSRRAGQAQDGAEAGAAASASRRSATRCAAARRLADPDVVKELKLSRTQCAQARRRVEERGGEPPPGPPVARLPQRRGEAEVHPRARVRTPARRCSSCSPTTRPPPSRSCRATRSTPRG